MSLVYFLTFAVFFQYLPCRSFPQVCYTFPDLLSQEKNQLSMSWWYEASEKSLLDEPTQVMMTHAPVLPPAGVPVPSSSVPSGTSPTSCARSAGPVLFRRPRSRGCTFYDPRVVLSQILIEVPEKVQPGPECLICGVERVPFFQLLCCSMKWFNVWFWWSWNFVFSLGLFGQI